MTLCHFCHQFGMSGRRLQRFFYRALMEMMNLIEEFLIIEHDK